MDTASIPAAKTEGKAARPCGCVVEGGRPAARCAVAESLWAELVGAREEVLRRSGRSAGHDARVETFHGRRRDYYRHLGTLGARS